MNNAGAVKITKTWLENRYACAEAYKWYLEKHETDPAKLLKLLIKESKPLEWGNWCITRRLKIADKVQYANFAAKEAKRVTRHISRTEQAAKCAADAAEWAADAAADAADADAAAAAAWAADAAAKCAANAAEWAAWAAVEYAAVTAKQAIEPTKAKRATMIKILKYGIKLLG